MKMYEEYKDSGVKWIGEVPSHWKIAPIKRFLSGMQDGTHGTYQTVDSGYPLLSAKNVFDTGLCIEDAERKISKDDYYCFYNSYASNLYGRNLLIKVLLTNKMRSTL